MPIDDRALPHLSPLKVVDPAVWLAAIVENSDDAILSKTLDGVIQSWNAGAERLFGFTAEEAVGRAITLILPQEKRAEEEDILGRLGKGERIHRFETLRRRKDGELIEVSLTVSPVRDPSGMIVGASTIARDISVERRSAERQTLLLKEMHHRIKNLFAMVAGLIILSARETADAADLADNLRERVEALAHAHALTLPDLSGRVDEEQTTSLKALLAALVAPHRRASESIIIEGEDLELRANGLTNLALLLHELTTNAVKYGALAEGHGRLAITIRRDADDDDRVRIIWTESGVATRTEASAEGFGTLLERTTVRGLDAVIDREWTDDGLVVTLSMPTTRLSPRP